MGINRITVLIAQLTILISLSLFPLLAYAYIDPNTGGFFMQTISPYLYFWVPFILWLLALIDILRSEFTGSNKIIWFFVVMIPYLGVILYLFIGRGQKVKAQTAKK